jgi:hypothetical protein
MKWQEPPKRRGHAHPESVWYQAEAAELRANPERWALFTTRKSPVQARNVAARIRTGVLGAFRPAGTFEARARDCDVYARYVGDPGE